MIVILGFFYTLAVVLWLTTGAIFYLINFSLIGTCLGLGMGLWPILPRRKKYIGRLISQFTVGGYLFFGLGCGLIYLLFGRIIPENLQIEGFWLLLFSGIFMAGVLHYLVAKIFGTLIFGRAWCGWACWTAAVLDLFPWKKSPGRLPKRWEYGRYIHFFLSFGLMVVIAFVLKHKWMDHAGVVLFKGDEFMGMKKYEHAAQIPEFIWFIVGNLLYYLAGIIMAVVLRDNRAFCKYLCPIVTFMKPLSRFSLMKVREVAPGCNDCGICEKNCPMDIPITEYTKKRKRISSTECILCHTCISSCPKKVLGVSFEFTSNALNINR